jgi:hypothetical protein
MIDVGIADVLAGQVLQLLRRVGRRRSASRPRFQHFQK